MAAQPMKQTTMSRRAGAWALAPGHSISLCPRQCGFLSGRGGRLWANGQVLDTDERVRVWSGERIQLRNVTGSDPGFFGWDYCVRQPASRLPAPLLSWCRSAWARFLARA
jgi:hypothetical protein